MSELIKREDAINAVEMFFKDAYIEDAEVHDLVYKINHIPTASPWHRVEEPPKEEGKYLVYDGRGNYHVAWWGQRLGWCYDPKFFSYWMPIEPPKEDA